MPLQFHVAYGDNDVDLADCDPLCLTAFLRATQERGVPVMLLHNYPFHRNAAYLAQVFDHVFMDIGLATHNSGALSATLVRESLELVPFGKFLFSSDAYGLAELYHLAALLFRRGLSQVLAELVEDGEMTRDDAVRVGRLVTSDNARRVYGLPRVSLVDAWRDACRASSRTPWSCGTSCTRNPGSSGDESDTAERVAAAIGAGPGRVVARTGRLVTVVGEPGATGPRSRSAPSSTAAACGRRPACRGRRRTAPCTPAATTCTWPPLVAVCRAARRLDLPVPLVAVLQPQRRAATPGRWTWSPRAGSTGSARSSPRTCSRSCRRASWA